MTNLNFKLLMSSILMVALCTSCKKKAKEEEEEGDNDYAYSITESALTEAGQMAYAVEAEETFFANNKMNDSIQPLATCNYADARSACTSSQITLNWNSCTLSYATAAGTATATLSGIINETYSGFGAASCLMTGNGSQLKRAISSSNPWTLTFPSGATLTRDMEPGTAFDGTTFSTASEGTTITRIETGTSNGLSCAPSARCYRLVANGLHKIFKGPRGRTWFEHIVDSDLSFTGKKSTGTRAMSGTATVWHEIAEYKAVHTFTNVAWGSSSCCYPTSGKIDTILTGAITGTTELEFSSTCGEATFTATDATEQIINLTHCSE